jgi:hypothetical protein
MKNLRQGSRTVREFTNDFEQLIDRMGSMTPEVKLLHYQNALRQDIREWVAALLGEKEETASLDQWVTLALRVEATSKTQSSGSSYNNTNKPQDHAAGRKDKAGKKGNRLCSKCEKWHRPDKPCDNPKSDGKPAPGKSNQGGGDKPPNKNQPQKKG